MDAEVVVERYADQGRCVAHIEGRVVFVRFALPGERLIVRLDEPHNRNDRFWTGETVKVLEASEYRTEPAWKQAGPLEFGGGVGGADLIHVSLPGQLAWKKAVIDEQMLRLGKIETDTAVERLEQDETSGGLHWRTRIETAANEQGFPSMHRRGTHDRIAIKDMPLATQNVLEVAEKTGLFDGGFNAGDHIRLSVPQFWAQDKSSDNYAVVVNGKVCAGQRLLTEKVSVGLPVSGGKKDFFYKVHASGFWQIHRCAPAALVSRVLSLAADATQGVKNPCVWDLYSGSGLFTVPLAADIASRGSVLSVEGATVAVKNAKKNIVSAGLNNVVARCGDVERVLRNVPSRLSKPDLVVLDPPRAGAKSKVCSLIAASGAKHVIYVACNPASLARDAGMFARLGYELADIHAVDIYPMTHHVETVILLCRANC